MQVTMTIDGIDYEVDVAAVKAGGFVVGSKLGGDINRLDRIGRKIVAACEKMTIEEPIVPVPQFGDVPAVTPELAVTPESAENLCGRMVSARSGLYRGLVTAHDPDAGFIRVGATRFDMELFNDRFTLFPLKQEEPESKYLPINHMQPWTANLHHLLNKNWIESDRSRLAVLSIAKKFGRTEGAIRCQLHDLGYGNEMRRLYNYN